MHGHVVAAQEPAFLRREDGKEDRALRLQRIRDKRPCECDYAYCARTVVVRAMPDFRPCTAIVIVVSADDHRFGRQCRVRTRQQAHHIGRRAPAAGGVFQMQRHDRIGQCAGLRCERAVDRGLQRLRAHPRAGEERRADRIGYGEHGNAQFIIKQRLAR